MHWNDFPKDYKFRFLYPLAGVTKFKSGGCYLIACLIADEYQVSIDPELKLGHSGHWLEVDEDFDFDKNKDRIEDNCISTMYKKKKEQELDSSVATKVKITEIDSKSSDKKYRVVVTGQDATCECDGFKYRKKCGHVDEALGKPIVAKSKRKKAVKSKKAFIPLF